jgi:hypothetical protein
MPRIGVESKKRDDPVSSGGETSLAKAAGADHTNPEETDDTDRVRTPADLRSELPDWTTLFAERRHLGAMESRLEGKSDWLVDQLSATIALLRTVLLDRAVQTRLALEGRELDEAEVEVVRRQVQQAWLSDPGIVRGLALYVNEAAASEDGATAAPVEVDCKSRVDQCQAACCGMLRALSKEEIVAGGWRWSLESPFFLPQDSDGYCTYLNRETHQCTVHENKPEACRTYTCERDREIWDDYWAKTPGPLLRSRGGTGDDSSREQ